MNVIERIRQGVQDLPTLPTVYSALCDVISNPRSTATDVAKVIATDQTSTLKLLRIANSAFFGLSGRIENVSRAVVVLGFDEVRNIILASTVMNLFQKYPVLQRFRPRDFWAHSIAVGLSTRLLGGLAGVKHLENYFVTGILHDIGKLFFFELLEKDYTRVLETVEKKKCLIRDAELEILGLDHSLLGSMMADQWKLPEPIRNAIHYHHFGMQGGETNLLVACIHVSDIMARSLELGYAGDDFIPQPNDSTWEILRLKPGMIRKMVPDLLRDHEEAMRTMFLN